MVGWCSFCIWMMVVVVVVVVVAAAAAVVAVSGGEGWEFLLFGFVLFFLKICSTFDCQFQKDAWSFCRGERVFVG